jgi:hypothetical protein
LNPWKLKKVARWTRSLPGGEGQAPEDYQEEKGKQESNQEEKGKLGAKHHSPASSSSPIPRSQLQNSSQQVDNFASLISLPVHENMHDWMLQNIPQTCKVVLCQVHHWDCCLSQIEITRVAASACASLASLDLHGMNIHMIWLCWAHIQ